MTNRKSAPRASAKAKDKAEAKVTTTAANEAETKATATEAPPAETTQAADTSPVATSEDKSDAAQAPDGTVVGTVQSVESIGPGEQIGGGGLPPVASARVLVRAVPKKGFWRAGRFWSPAGIEVGIDELTEDQWAALVGEPKIAISGVE